MEIKEIGSGIFACLMGNHTANAGFVVTSRGAVVIDTLDKPENGRRLAREIEARSGTAPFLVINTHFHTDHTFGNQAFDVPVIGHCSLAQLLAKATSQTLMPVAVAAWLSEHPEDRWLVDELELVYPSVTFERQLVLDVVPHRLVVRHLGGHTPDSCIVDLPEAGILFAGDLVFEGRVPFLRQANFAETVAALRSIEARGDRIVVPGHGQLCDTAYVARTADYLEELRRAVSALIDHGVSKAGILDCRNLPRWWTGDRPELVRANLERLYNELVPPD
jgi:cyclase